MVPGVDSSLVPISRTLKWGGMVTLIKIELVEVDPSSPALAADEATMAAMAMHLEISEAICTLTLGNHITKVLYWILTI